MVRAYICSHILITHQCLIVFNQNESFTTVLQRCGDCGRVDIPLANPQKVISLIYHNQNELIEHCAESALQLAISAQCILYTVHCAVIKIIKVFQQRYLYIWLLITNNIRYKQEESLSPTHTQLSVLSIEMAIAIILLLK